MAKKRKKDSAVVAAIVTVPFDTIHQPVPQRTPLDDKQREWEDRKMKYDYPYRHQNIAQRIYGEVVRYRLDPKFMTTEGTNQSTKDNDYLVR